MLVSVRTPPGYRRINDRLKQLRRAEVLDYDRIVDGLLAFVAARTGWASRAFAKSMSRAYRVSPLDALDYNVIMWVESRSLAGMIADIPEEFGVTLYPAGGHTSMTFAYECAQDIRRTGKLTHVLYFGDYDTAGTEIDRFIRKELRVHTDAVLEPFIRIGINPGQIIEHELPTKTGKERFTGVTRAR